MHHTLSAESARQWDCSCPFVFLGSWRSDPGLVCVNWCPASHHWAIPPPWIVISFVPQYFFLNNFVLCCQFLKFLYVCECFVCVYVSFVSHAWSSRRSEEGYRLSGSGDTAVSHHMDAGNGSRASAVVTSVAHIFPIFPASSSSVLGSLISMNLDKVRFMFLVLGVHRASWVYEFDFHLI